MKIIFELCTSTLSSEFVCVCTVQWTVSNEVISKNKSKNMMYGHSGLFYSLFSSYVYASFISVPLIVVARILEVI